jgi:N-dimethylarginine dimethylaminohydrolase
MVGALERVLVCSPQVAGWGEDARVSAWQSLGYRHRPLPGDAAAQHGALVKTLEESGAEVMFLPGDGALTLDAVYTHDASFPTNHGMVLMNPGKSARRGEANVHERVFRALGIPILGAIEPPGVMEGGDLVWLDEETVLAGEGYRTNAEGIAQLGRMLEPQGVRVLDAPLPHGAGPTECLHLMSLLSMLDHRVALVDLSWLAVRTVRELVARDLELVPIADGERDTMACNVLALGDRRLLAIEANTATNERLRERGFDVRTFPASEISGNGSGGPTCLTRPILREN